MAFIYLIFVVAAAISGVAAYFSLVGLGSIFAATFWGVIIMGAALEVGKIVTAKWIHANWKNPQAPWFFRGLLCFFVACLMAITSLGIYGYLSKGHLEQKAPLAGLDIQVAQLETQMKQKQDENTRLENRLSQISKITDKVLEGNAKAGLRASNQSKSEAAGIQKSIDTNNQTINDITQKLVPLKMQAGKVEGELGVAKYIADALGWDGDKAIRIIISLIMAAFDPLAISMFIMGSISLAKRKEEREQNVLPTVEASEPIVDHDVEEVEEVGEVGEIDIEDVEDEKTLEAVPALTEEEVAEFKNELAARFISDLEASAQAERAQLLNDLHAEIAAKREALEADLEESKSVLNTELESIEAQRISLADDYETLQAAHAKLVEMELHINEERELLEQWEEQLTAQQNAINTWSPTNEDTRPDKEKILEMLERNPQVVNDIVSTVDAMRHVIKPGL